MAQSKEDKEKKELDLFTEKMQDLYKDIDKNIWVILYQYERFNYLYKNFYEKHDRYQISIDLARLKIERAEDYICVCEPIASKWHYKEDEVSACREQITHLSNRVFIEGNLLEEKEKTIDNLCYEIAKSLKIAASVKDDSSPEDKAVVEQAMDDYVQGIKKFEKHSKIYAKEIETKENSFEDVVTAAHSTRDEAEELYGLFGSSKTWMKMALDGGELTGETLRKLKEEAIKAYQNGKDTKVEEEYTRLVEALKQNRL